MLKYANFEDWYPSGKFYLFDIFLVSEGSLGPKPPTYPAPARFFLFQGFWLFRSFATKFILQFILKSCRSCIGATVLEQHYIKVESRVLRKIQSRIDLFPVYPRAFIKPVWSGIESSTTLFHCYHQTTWFVCLVQFIFDQFLILIVLERLTHLKFSQSCIKEDF